MVFRQTVVTQAGRQCVPERTAAENKDESLCKIKTFRNFVFPKSNQKLKLFGNVDYDKKRNIFVATARIERCSDY